MRTKAVEISKRFIISIFSLFVTTLMLEAGARAQSTARVPPDGIDRRVDAMLANLTLEQKIDLISGEDSMFIKAMPVIGLPRLKMSDGPMGVRTWGTTSGYAAGIGLAASWDTDLAKRVGASIGQDARARGVNFLLGPGVNIYRAPMNGRNFEYFGEDPYLGGQIAAHYIQGVQSQGVVATVKHYACNNSEYDRHNVNSVADERTLREIYLPIFEAAVKEGHVGAVMDSYNLINGEHATQNTFLNTEVLKKEWGFQGVLMSDWGATYDGVAAANSGLDLEMPSGRFMNREILVPFVQSGKVSTATIDDKVRRILRIALEYHFLDRDQTELGVPFYSQQARETALKSAQESVVLLKNQGGLLPLDVTRVHTIAVIGPDAYPAVPSAGGSARITAFAPVSLMTGLSDALGTRAKVLWSGGVKDVQDIFAGRTGAIRNPPAFWVDAEAKQPGLLQEEFPNPNFKGKPDQKHVVPDVNRWQGFQWAPAVREKRSVRWTGYYQVPNPGPQTFVAAAIGGDAYRLYVDDKLVLEKTSHEGQAPQFASVSLPAGQMAAVRFDYLPVAGTIRAGLAALPAADIVEPDAIKIAKLADVAILSVGFNPSTESEGFDRTYRLPPGQDELIQAVLAANPHTVVVVTAGGSVDTSRWIDRTPAFIQAWYGGDEAGRGLADVLLGRVSPSGRLPITWERRIEDDPAYPNYYEAPGTKDVVYKEGIFVGYRGYEHNQVKPLFPFGFGLSYTTFAFSNLSVTPAAASPNGPVTVSFDVRNTGHRAGAEVAQVYVGELSPKVPRPLKELKGFERVTLAPGATRRVTVKLNRRSLAYWDVASKNWKVDPGKFEVYVGDSSAHVPLKKEFTVR